RKRGSTTTSVRATPADVRAVLQEVLQTSPLGFKDGDPQVRKLCAEAFHLAALAIPEPSLPSDLRPWKVLPAPGRALSADELKNLDTMHKELKSQIDELKPAFQAMRLKVGELLPLLSDADGQARFAGISALRSVAETRQRV